MSIEDKDRATRHIEDCFEAVANGDGLLSDEQYETIRNIVNMIWANKVPGVRFDCGGAGKQNIAHLNADDKTKYPQEANQRHRRPPQLLVAKWRMGRVYCLNRERKTK